MQVTAFQMMFIRSSSECKCLKIYELKSVKCYVIMNMYLVIKFVQYISREVCWVGKPSDSCLFANHPVISESSGDTHDSHVFVL